jgi:Protein of unknown function (DUF3135)
MFDKADEFPFDSWAALARNDPQAFELARKEMIAGLIDAAPERLRSRLEGLQWQVDTLRQRAPNPLSACLKISSLMWDNVLGEQGLAARLRELGTGERKASPLQPGQVVAFKPREDTNRPG